MLYVYEINSKISSLIIYFGFGGGGEGVSSYFWTKTFSFGRHVLFGGRLRLQSSFIQVIMASSFCSL